MPKYNVDPNTLDRPKAVRGAYLYNLVDCLHTCILRRDLPRARRAWAILVRCPDVNWRDRWSWALYLLTAEAGTEGPAPGQSQSQSEARAQARTEDDGSDAEDGDAPPNPYSQPSQQMSYSQREPGQDAFLFLRDIRLSSKEGDKPAVLAEMVLHLIAVGRYRHALDELTTYLLDYPYTLSASLHTYAGMVCFYLAQPESMRRVPKPIKDKGTPKTPTRGRERETTADSDRTEGSERRKRDGTADSDASDSTVDRTPPPPDGNYIRQARGWFQKALVLDPTEAVAKGFIQLIDKPAQDSDDERDLDDSFDQSREIDQSENEHENENENEVAVASQVVDGDVDMEPTSDMDVSPAIPPRPLVAQGDRDRVDRVNPGGYYSGDSESEGEAFPQQEGVGARLGRRRSARFSGAF